MLKKWNISLISTSKQWNRFSKQFTTKAKKIYRRKNENELFDKITKTNISKHKLSWISGMAGVGKSTLAIMYGYHRREVNEAKVCIFF